MIYIPSDDVRESAIQAVRSWAKRVLGLTDSGIIPQAYGNDDVPSPDPPYYVVKFRSSGDVGVDEEINGFVGGEQLTLHRGFRRGVVTVEGVGPATFTGLERLRLRTSEFYPTPDPLGGIPEGAPGFSLTRTLTPVQEIPSFEGQQWELRFRVDFELSYAVLEEAQGKVAAESLAATTVIA